MLRRVLGPKWIVLHVTVLVAVLVMVNLGLWQLNRLDERRAFNAAVSARTVEPVTDLAELVPDRGGEPGDARWRDLEWRRVRVRGSYDAAGAVTIVNRSTGGTAGVDSLLPFRFGDGRVVLVNRGFIPLALDVPGAPAGDMEVVGYLRVTQTRSALGAIDSSDPSATEFQRVDIARLSEQIQGTMSPMWIQLAEQTPAPSAPWPAPVPLPELSEGPHLSYAGQWFFFCLVALVGWAIVVRRGLRTVPPGS